MRFDPTCDLRRQLIIGALHEFAGSPSALLESNAAPDRRDCLFDGRTLPHGFANDPRPGTAGPTRWRRGQGPELRYRASALTRGLSQVLAALRKKLVSRCKYAWALILSPEQSA